jgi:prepilin signal peptidase PulO-like enzyme (type II secretory pathway)
MIYLAVGVRNIVLFMFAVSAICGVVMLIWRSERDKRLPLIPALTAGYVITIIMGGGVC